MLKSTALGRCGEGRGRRGGADAASGVGGELSVLGKSFHGAKAVTERIATSTAPGTTRGFCGVEWCSFTGVACGNRAGAGLCALGAPLGKSKPLPHPSGPLGMISVEYLPRPWSKYHMS